jgi:hypothetical protein
MALRSAPRLSLWQGPQKTGLPGAGAKGTVADRPHDVQVMSKEARTPWRLRVPERASGSNPWAWLGCARRALRHARHRRGTASALAAKNARSCSEKTNAVWQSAHTLGRSAITTLHPFAASQRRGPF